MPPKKLQPIKFTPLPLGTVRPTGWLKNQLEVQVASLSGHLDEFWHEVQDSAWFGRDGETWERGPYWLDGVVPLVFLIDDQPLKDRVLGYVDYILEHQHEDGLLGPAVDAAGHDIWSLFLILKTLVCYHDATGDERVPGAVERCLRKIDQRTDFSTLFNWAQFRWFESLISIFWLYERTGEQWLLDLAAKLRGEGFDWAGYFSDWPKKKPTPQDRWNQPGHVVNNAMAIKEAALWWRYTGKEKERRATYRMIELLEKYHGMVTGVFTGDECLAGTDPIQGTELCAVLEYMYSLEIMLSIMGDPAWGDRLEKITFNAWPATFTPDMWGHQYDQQVNQVECSLRDDRCWNTNGGDANIFGVAPNCACCTANFSQGWPRFAAHLWMRTETDLVAVAYAPSKANASFNNTDVTVELDTEYPFRDRLRFEVSVDAPVTFGLVLRIPQWATGATLTVDGESVSEALVPGSFHRIDREWQAKTEVVLVLPMTAVVTQRPRKTIALERGPLVYSLKIEEEWKRINEDAGHAQPPHEDWEIYAASPWNYALDVGDPGRDLKFSEHPIGDLPFSPEGAPVSCKAQGRQIPGWKIKHGSAGRVPRAGLLNPGASEEITLIPYGCTNLRMTEFPVLPDMGK